MKNNKIIWIVSVLPMLISVLVISFMPDTIPMHYNAAGIIDRWGSKYEIFIMPVIVLLISLMWIGMIKHYNKKADKAIEEKGKTEALSNVKVLRVVAIVESVFFGLLHIASICGSYIEATENLTESAVDISAVSSILIGIMLVVLGNFMPKTKRNSVVGFRTAKTMSDDEIWRKVNRFAGITFMVAGVITVIAGIAVGGIASTFISIGIIGLTTVIDLIYVARLK